MSDWETNRKPALMARLLSLPRYKKINMIRKAKSYRSGTDSCNSVYMGSMATSQLLHSLGGSYGKDDLDQLLTQANDAQLNKALDICASYIETMEKHPTEPCPCCGQIVAASSVPGTGIENLLKKAVAAFNALSPEQQAEMLEEQRQSWVRGNVGLSRDERGMTSPVMPHPTTVMASELERKEAFLKVWFDAPENIHWAHGMSNGVEKDISNTFDRAIAAWNARPAPAVTDTGLETVGYTTAQGENYATGCYLVKGVKLYGMEAVVARSQAVELLAEKDERLKDWQNKWAQTDLLRLKAEADNAAQAARIKELETERTMIVSHATMGQTDGIGLTVNDISVRVTALRNKLYDEGKKHAEALEAKLAAAEKVREAAIELDEAISDDFNIFGAQQKLRAVLGGKS